MANRFFNQFRKCLEKEQVNLFAHVSFGAAGAPTLDNANSKGIKSISRVSAGKYTIVFGLSASSTFATNIDTYVKLLGLNHKFLNSSAPAAPLSYIVTNSVTSGSVVVQFTDSAGVATDPASGEQVYLEIAVGNSSAI
jgi:hypothetical protein